MESVLWIKIMEFITEAAGKNLHLEHLEDEILNFGIAGGRSAINFLQALRDMFAGKTGSGMNVTVKWDGAPAVFAGPHPETGKFFVATKSLFRKRNAEGAYYHTDADINADKSGELASKLKTSLKYLSKLGMTQILQGDLMFTDDVGTADIDGEKHYTFKPNTILYAVPVNSKIGKQIKAAKIGIVWHTTYKGSTIEDLKATFGAKIPKKSTAVWQDDAKYKDVSGKATFTAKDTVKITKLLSQAGSQFHRIDAKSFNKFLKWQNDMPPGVSFKTYLNTYTRAGKKLPPSGKVVAGYFKHFNDWWKKNKKGETADKNLRSHLAVIRTSTTALKNVIDFMSYLIQAKLMLVKKMNQATGLAKTFVRTPKGLKCVAPEGYVAIDHTGGAVKIVDKLEFSFNNFTVAKSWDK
jgi:hypothetical protein